MNSVFRVAFSFSSGSNSIRRTATLWRVLWLGIVLAAAVSLRAAPETFTRQYEGGWTNLTFGSTGQAAVTIQIVSNQVTIDFDLDGFVFGEVDPPVMTVRGFINGPILQLDSRGVGIYGDITGTYNFNDGSFSSILTNVPGGRIDYVTLAGPIAPDLINLSYSVYFPGQPSSTNPAKGVLVAAALALLRIDSVQIEGDHLTVRWSGGKAPYQVQTRNSLSSGTWSNSGSSTAATLAQVPLSSAQTIFIRVSGP